MTKSILDAMQGHLKARTHSAAKSADLLRSAADRLDTADPTETRAEQAARLRGSAILALTGALELASCSGFLDAVVVVELNEVPGDEVES